MQDYKDPHHNLPIHQIISLPPILYDATEPTNEPTKRVTPFTDVNALGSILINGQHYLVQTQAPRRLTKASFNNKSYLGSYYKDSTIHITTNSGHDANQPLPINPDPLVHVLGTALIHIANPEAWAVVFEQANSFREGIQKFGQAGEMATITELTQLHDYQVYNPIEANSLSPVKWKTALKSLMNIVEKRYGCVCAHACADGSKECREPGYKKKDCASPTVATDSIMITATIDAQECHNVASVDIHGAFLHAYNDKDTFMLLRGFLAEVMVQVDPALYHK